MRSQTRASINLTLHIYTTLDSSVDSDSFITKNKSWSTHVQASTPYSPKVTLIKQKQAVIMLDDSDSRRVEKWVQIGIGICKDRQARKF